MNPAISFDHQVSSFGFWSAAVAMVTLVASLFIPLDVPGGYAAEHADRVVWLNANRGTFILGWINQVAAMLSLSGIFFGITWQIAKKSNYAQLSQRWLFLFLLWLLSFLSS